MSLLLSTNPPKSASYLSLNNCSNSGIPGSDLRLRVLPVVAFTFILQNFGFTIIGSSGFML